MTSSETATNAPEWSVAELAGALKRTLEDRFGLVRVRGEIFGYRGPHSSGHSYFSLKDREARLDAVIWRGTASRLRFKPQEGLEVVATGRITTFPGKSAYQIVIEQLEPAGAGALMALLEERRKALVAEGLFAAERKRLLPYLPRLVGVVTSPTGAVIRDILHRLAHRFPRDVILWPVRVQGETSGAEVAAAIAGLNALAVRPDVIIVARGGGSLEDLWGFNDEAVVRAAVASAIPIVSAIGHETDWTLLDHAADVRAPTPTGAAEMVVPVRAELLARVAGLDVRLGEGMGRSLDLRIQALRSAARVLPSPEMLLAPRRQRLDLAAARLAPALLANARDHEIRLRRACDRLARHTPRLALAEARGRLDSVAPRSPVALRRLLAERGARLADLSGRLRVGRETALRAERLRLERCRERLGDMTMRAERAAAAGLERRANRLTALAELLGSLGYRSVLARGYVVVRSADGQAVARAAGVAPGQMLELEFADGRRKVQAEGGRPEKGGRRAPSSTDPLAQPSLFEQ
ncbi:exodeoxyribonuclease VII large subunit [Enterovirga sp.]|uniref:exodeoxyribonuclease VII large subunit n=1 Tax=Enterovirga sp. TaxID=2026350 RepID=UPI002C46CF3A|nr:exodeoxyribonuclease VII large subunit [Enterovirga sp.]HMO29152.1 exodeoxyribonuclease VII large subunit [Enterovirga sp.]